MSILGLTGARLYGALFGLALLVGALGWLVWTVRDRDRLAGIVAHHEQCSAALGGKRGAEPVATVCEPAIWAAVEARDAAAACDAALAKADAYQIRMTCSTEVKDVEADRATFAATNADLAAQLTQARGEIGEAVTRAETRVATANRRTLDANEAAARAPRDPDGLVVCAGDCLRALGGEPPAANARAAKP